jgi:Mn2+/Fe2+ NRAMP family transporter
MDMRMGTLRQAEPNTPVYIRPSFFGRAVQLLPGIVAGAADLDPAAVLTATVAGAAFGTSLGWVVVLCVPVLFSVFAVSSRIGHQTRKGLVELIRENYSQTAAVAIAGLIAVVNLAMIIGDIVAVSDGFSLITMAPRAFFLAIVGFTVWYVLIIGNYQQTTKVLGALTLILVAYLIAAYRVTDSFIALGKDVLLPHMQVNTGYMMGVVAVFGSLLTPNVIVWQTSSRRGLPEGLAAAHVTESHAGTFVACLISLSAMVAASHLHISDPSNMTTRMASEAMGSFGFLGTVLFALGIIASGMIALPILVASLCFSVAEAVGWKSGLGVEPWNARMFYVMISGTVFVAVVIDFFHVNTVHVLYWSQVLAGIVLVPIFAFILLLSNNMRVMRTTNSHFENFWLGCAATGMLIANVLFFWFQLR